MLGQESSSAPKMNVQPPQLKSTNQGKSFVISLFPLLHAVFLAETPHPLVSTQSLFSMQMSQEQPELCSINCFILCLSWQEEQRQSFLLLSQGYYRSCPACSSSCFEDIYSHFYESFTNFPLQQLTAASCVSPCLCETAHDNVV